MNIIETHDLCKQYGNALRVAHLDLNVPEGSVYGFLGPNGAGKSTTLKMILGLVRPTAGNIQVLGKKMDGANRLSILRQVGSLIESPSYYGHLTGEENLRIVQTLRGVPERNIREVLQIVRLDGQRGKKVAHYSLGMKQRLGLAAALLGFARENGIEVRFGKPGEEVPGVSVILPADPYQFQVRDLDLDKMRHSLIKTALKTYTATPTEADYEFLAQETNKSVDWVREQVAAIVPTL